MAFCTRCGKETDWTSKSGYCKECANAVLKKQRKATNGISRKILIAVLCTAVALAIVIPVLVNAANIRKYEKTTNELLSFFGAAGYIIETDNLVMIAILDAANYNAMEWEENPVESETKIRISNAFVEKYIGIYPNVSQVTTIILTDEADVIMAWNYSLNGELINVDSDIALAAFALAYGASEEGLKILDESRAETYNYYDEGAYKVGHDLPSGEYMFISTDSIGYFEIASDGAGTLDGIIANGIVPTWTYITVSNGQHVEITRGTLIPMDEAPAITDIFSGSGEGTYLVGRDIEPGEYAIAVDDSPCYIQVSTDSTHSTDSIKTNDIIEGNTYITVEKGDYLTITRGHIVE